MPGHPNRSRSSKDRRSGVGKGDRQRPTDKHKYDENYSKIDWNDTGDSEEVEAEDE